MKTGADKCRVEGCSNSSARADFGTAGYCNAHYKRLRRFGDVTVCKSVPRPAKDWLLAHVAHDGEDCLTWPFATGSDGYGRVHHFETKALTTAARLMCIQAHGEPPRRHQAAHSCGNGHRGCVNPRHLYWATHTVNQSDRVKHGTTNRGERQWKAKLTADDVQRIRKLLGSKSQAEIARLFGVDPSHISNIKRGKDWSWLP